MLFWSPRSEVRYTFSFLFLYDQECSVWVSRENLAVVYVLNKYSQIYSQTYLIVFTSLGPTFNNKTKLKVASCQIHHLHREPNGTLMGKICNSIIRRKYIMHNHRMEIECLDIYEYDKLVSSSCSLQCVR